jgi:hypothetical protein
VVGGPGEQPRRAGAVFDAVGDELVHDEHDIADPVGDQTDGAGQRGRPSPDPAQALGATVKNSSAVSGAGRGWL